MLAAVQHRYDHALRRIEAREGLRRWLPWAALALGVGWIGLTGWRGGIRAGHDTAAYLQGMNQLLREGHPLTVLYSEQVLPAHMTTLWMALLGAKGFVLLTAVLTALLPLLMLTTLRQVHAGTFWCLVALAYVAVNPEVYQWAWFALTDGFFLIQVVILLAVLTRPRYPRAWWLLIPLLLYHLLYTRPTGLLLLPGLIVFALLEPERKWRWGLLSLGCVAAAWVIAWMQVAGGTRDVHRQIVQRMFISGQVLNDPRMDEPMPVPFTETERVEQSLGALCRAYPGYCASYYARKLAAYFFPVYPKYSVRHKLFNALYFGSLILLSIAGLWLAFVRRAGRVALMRASPRRQVQAMLFCVTAIVTAGAFHTVTHSDPDARFLMVWVPVWICGVALLWSYGSRGMAGPAKAVLSRAYP